MLQLVKSIIGFTRLYQVYGWSEFLCVCFHDCKGYLDDLFTQLQKFQDANNPRFVVKVISTYFEDSEKTLSDLNGTMYVLSLISRIQ